MNDQKIDGDNCVLSRSNESESNQSFNQSEFRINEASSISTPPEVEKLKTKLTSLSNSSINLQNTATGSIRVIKKIQKINTDKIQRDDVKHKLAEALKKFREIDKKKVTSQYVKNLLNKKIMEKKEKLEKLNDLHYEKTEASEITTNEINLNKNVDKSKFIYSLSQDNEKGNNDKDSQISDTSSSSSARSRKIKPKVNLNLPNTSNQQKNNKKSIKNKKLKDNISTSLSLISSFSDDDDDEEFIGFPEENLEIEQRKVHLLTEEISRRNQDFLVQAQNKPKSSTSIPSFSNLKSYLFQKWQTGDEDEEANKESSSVIKKEQSNIVKSSSADSKNNVKVIVEVNKNSQTSKKSNTLKEKQSKDVHQVKKTINKPPSSSLATFVNKCINEPSQVTSKNNSDLSQNKAEINHDAQQQNISPRKRTVLLKVLNHDPVSGKVQVTLIDPIISTEVVKNVTNLNKVLTDTKPKDQTIVHSSLLEKSPQSTSLEQKFVPISKSISIEPINRLDQHKIKKNISTVAQEINPRKSSLNECDEKLLMPPPQPPSTTTKPLVKTSELKTEKHIILRQKEDIKGQNVENVQEIINQKTSRLLSTPVDVGKEVVLGLVKKACSSPTKSILKNKKSHDNSEINEQMVKQQLFVKESDSKKEDNFQKEENSRNQNNISESEDAVDFILNSTNSFNFSNSENDDDDDDDENFSLDDMLNDDEDDDDDFPLDDIPKNNEDGDLNESESEKNNEGVVKISNLINKEKEQQQSHTNETFIPKTIETKITETEVTESIVKEQEENKNVTVGPIIFENKLLTNDEKIQYFPFVVSAAVERTSHQINLNDKIIIPKSIKNDDCQEEELNKILDDKIPQENINIEEKTISCENINEKKYEINSSEQPKLALKNDTILTDDDNKIEEPLLEENSLNQENIVELGKKETIITEEPKEKEDLNKNEVVETIVDSTKTIQNQDKILQSNSNNKQIIMSQQNQSKRRSRRVLPTIIKNKLNSNKQQNSKINEKDDGKSQLQLKGSSNTKSITPNANEKTTNNGNLKITENKKVSDRKLRIRTFSDINVQLKLDSSLSKRKRTTSEASLDSKKTELTSKRKRTISEASLDSKKPEITSERKRTTSEASLDSKKTELSTKRQKLNDLNDYEERLKDKNVDAQKEGSRFKKLLPVEQKVKADDNKKKEDFFEVNAMVEDEKEGIEKRTEKNLEETNSSCEKESKECENSPIVQHEEEIKLEEENHEIQKQKISQKLKENNEENSIETNQSVLHTNKENLIKEKEHVDFLCEKRKEIENENQFKLIEENLKFLGEGERENENVNNSEELLSNQSSTNFSNFSKDEDEDFLFSKSFSLEFYENVAENLSENKNPETPVEVEEKLSKLKNVTNPISNIPNPHLNLRSNQDKVSKKSSCIEEKGKIGIEFSVKYDNSEKHSDEVKGKEKKDKRENKVFERSKSRNSNNKKCEQKKKESQSKINSYKDFRKSNIKVEEKLSNSELLSDIYNSGNDSHNEFSNATNENKSQTQTTETENIEKNKPKGKRKKEKKLSLQTDSTKRKQIQSDEEDNHNHNKIRTPKDSVSGNNDLFKERKNKEKEISNYFKDHVSVFDDKKNEDNPSTSTSVNCDKINKDVSEILELQKESPPTTTTTTTKGKQRQSDEKKLHPKLLLVTKRSDLNNDNLEESIINENIKKLPKQNEFKCGLCKKIITKKGWMVHLSEHYGIGWKEGIEAPINVESFRDCVQASIRYFKESKIKSLKCRLCGNEMRSGLGIIGHLENCNLTKEEKEKQLIKCEYCNKKFTQFSILSHQRQYCAILHAKNSEMKKKNDENNESSNVCFTNLGRSKRQSVIKAEKKIAEDILNEEKDKAEKFILPYKPITGRALIWKFRLQLKSNNVGKCIGKECNFTSSNVDVLCKHNEICDKVPRGGYICSECTYHNMDKNEAIDHYNNTHKNESIATTSDAIFKGDNESDVELDSESSESQSDDGGTDGDLDDNMEVKQKFKKIRNRWKKKSKETTSDLKYRNLIVSEGHLQEQMLCYQRTLQFYKCNFSEHPLFTFATPTIIKIQNPLVSYFPRNVNSMKFALSNKLKFNKSFGSSEKPKKWEQIERFATHHIDEEKLIFMGGAVTCLSWIPKNSSTILNNVKKTKQIFSSSQYLAISCKNDIYKFTKSIEPQSQQALIMIYKLSNEQKYKTNDMDDDDDDHDDDDDDDDNKEKVKFNSENSKLKLLYGIPFDTGPIHHIEFLPSGGYSSELNRLGLMAVACIKSDIKIYSLPLKASKNCDNKTFLINNDNKFINLKPIIILKLDLRKINDTTCVNLKFYKEAQCTKICWAKDKGHNIIVGAYSNSFIAIWNIEEKDNLNRYIINGTRNFLPVCYFQPTTDVITGLDLHYDLNGLRWLLVSTRWKENFIFDIKCLNYPKIVTQENESVSINHSLWPTIWENPIYCGSQAMFKSHGYLNSMSPLGIHYNIRRLLRVSSDLVTFDFNSWLNFGATGSVNGDLLLQYFTVLNLNLEAKSKNDTRSWISYTDLIRLDGEPIVNDINNEEIDLFNPNNYEKYGLIISKLKACDNNIHEATDVIRCSPFWLNTFIKINKISCNNNETGNKLIAIGYENGLVRIIHV